MISRVGVRYVDDFAFLHVVLNALCQHVGNILVDIRECRDQGALLAGVDIDMMTGCYAGELAKLVKEGTIPESLIDESVLRILQLKNQLGLFEHPHKDADPEKEARYILCPEHRALAREAAAASSVSA